MKRKKLTIIAGDYNSPLSIMDRTTGQKIDKEIIDLNNTISQLDLPNIYGTLHPTMAGQTFFSSEHGTFSSIYNMFGHRFQ